MMNPLYKTEPENMEMVKEKKTKERCPLPDDLYDKNGKGEECWNEKPKPIKKYRTYEIKKK